MRHLVWISVALGISTPQAQARGPEKPITPGTHVCITETETALTKGGICFYRSLFAGEKNVLDGLLRQARDFVRSDRFNEDSGGIEPHIEKDYLIAWWLPAEGANDRLASFLKKMDRRPDLAIAPRVNVTIKMYSIQMGTEREFGMHVGAFYGTKTLGENEQKPSKFSLNVLEGLGQTVVGLGNPLASFLKIGLDMSVNKMHAEEILEVTYECLAGAYCSKSHSSPYYFRHVTGAGPENGNIGMFFSAEPILDASDPNLVNLKNLDVTYSVPTGVAESPIDRNYLYQYQNKPFRTDEMYVISKESLKHDIRTGKLLGSSKDSNHKRFVAFMWLEVVDGMSRVSKSLRFEDMKVSWTPEELKALPNNQLSLADIFGSLEKKCYKDYMNPSVKEPICGFRLTKMDRRFVDLRVTAQVKGKVSFGERKKEYFQLGELYVGKGYYQLPMLNQDKPSEYEFSIELPSVGEAARERRKAEKIKGARIKFVYTPGEQDPVDEGKLRWID